MPAEHPPRTTAVPDGPEQAWPTERLIHQGRRHPVGGLLGRIVTLVDRVAAPFWRQPLLLLVLMGLTTWAGIWGFTAFYGPQFARTPWYTWPFIPDSPLSTTAWMVAAVLVWLGWDKRPSVTGRGIAFFAHWAAMMNVKVGLWTVFVLLFHYDHFFEGPGADPALQWMLVASHAGMVGLAILLLRKMQALPPGGYLLILALALLWDFVDYALVDLFLPGSGLRLYPNGVPHEGIRIVGAVTVSLSLLSTWFVTIVMRRRGPPLAH